MEKIIKTKTFYQSVVTSSATIINGLLGVTFYILVARILGPVEFGMVTVALTTLTLIADMATIGADTGIVRFVGKYYQKDKIKALRFLKLGFKLKAIVAAVVFSVGWFTAPLAASLIFGKPELTMPLRYAVAGAAGMLVFSFTTSALQAMQKFWTWGLINILANSLRLGAIVFLATVGLLSLDLTLASYIACIFLGFFTSLLFLPNFFKAKGEDAYAKEFLHYNKWVGAFVVVAALSGRLDTFMATKLLSLGEVGIYGVATGLAAVGSQVVAGITTVVAPKLAGFESDVKAIIYLKKLQMLSLGLGFAAVIFGIPIGYFMIKTLYGPQFVGSIFPLSILIISQAIFIISIPAHSSVIYYFGYPKLFVYISIVHLAIIGGLGWVLITNMGYVGAAITVLVGNISNFLIPAVWALRKFKK